MKILFTIAVLFPCFLSPACFGADDHQFEGKSVEAWINILFGRPEQIGDPSPSKEMQQQALEVFHKMGSGELDYLVDQLSSTNRNKLQAGSIIMILKVAGSNAIPEIPKLIKKLDQDDSIALPAATCLIDIGTNAVPPLIRALSEKNARTRRYAAYALGQIKPHPKAAVALLLERAKNDEPEVRYSAISSLGLIGEYPEKVVPVLIQNLNSEDAIIRGNSAFSIGCFSKDAKVEEAAPKLFKLLNDENGDVRNNSASALMRMNLGKEYIPLLATNASNPDLKVRCLIAQALGKQGAYTNEVFPILLKMTKDQDRYVRESAGVTINQMGYKPPVDVVKLRGLYQ